jgi:hypothetical protein
MVRLDPHYRIVFGEGGELDAMAEVSRMEAQIAQLRLADAAGFGASSRRIGTSSDGWSRVWSSIPWLAGHFQRPAFKDAADAAASSVDRHLSEAVLS